jgi:predicted porin
MTKTFITIAALAGMAGTALAQQVTVYGRVDLSIAQRPGQPDNLELRNGSGSRFGVRGVEDLGGGLRAVFGLEHRFDADTGEAASPFWGGKSVVGLSGGFGTVTLGRDDNPAVKMVQEAADPWAGDTVAGNGNIYDGNIGSSRYSNAVTYRGRFGGFEFGAQVTEGDGLDDRPVNLALAYRAGPLYAAIGHDNPGNADDQWTSVMARYDLGGITVSGLYGTGTDRNDLDVDAWLLALTARLGGGQLRASVGQRENEGVADDYKQFGLGYHYPLSKRTTVYADVVNVDPVGAGRNKTGYDVGIRHNF